MASHSVMQQQIKAMQQQITAMQQQIAAYDSVYMVPSIPVSRQLLGPTVPGYQPFLPAQSLPPRQATLSTPYQPIIPVQTLQARRAALPAQSLPVRRTTRPTAPLPRSRSSKATRTVRATRADQTRTPAQRAARQRSFHQRLAAVNGIASPSKVPRGHRPFVPDPPKRRSNLKWPCARCAHRCSYKENVRSHFPACLKRNGNPDRLRWDDAINGVVAAPL